MRNNKLHSKTAVQEYLKSAEATQYAGDFIPVQTAMLIDSLLPAVTDTEVGEIWDKLDYSKACKLDNGDQCEACT